MPSRISFFKSKVQFRFSNKSGIIRWIESVIRKEGKKSGSINFIFCSDKFLLGINKQYLKHDYFTDIVTFDYTEGNVVSGEVYISVDRVKENGQTLGVNFKDELNRVIIHGVLHLLGYSDKTKALKYQMRKKEDSCLAQLN